ncbi:MULTISPECIES: LacI family DNA-binding transcriptional regulator [Niveibacterium]|uniref:LacI family DNA-binding transcriptional regulator n=1 Tax=Niveibacterium microcysteis TaxID=2811415 RepID=A0ABX7M978_9RHOO|nr:MULTISPECIES: LacI family DNA-binding transcriptional regulator [Niveibacterium]QSI78290.1 LacI family DNA-binding transcriptional regulator [Niveibacterium microcysteis]
MARIIDVAKHAGVSVASVSRVLSGLPGVSEDTRARVQAAAKALNYRPDLAARRLRSRRTDTIGLIVSDIRNPFFTEVSRAVEDMAYEHGQRVILCNADEDPEKEAFYLELMHNENVSGVILSPTLQLLSQFRASDYTFPVVLVDRCERSTEADAVVLDNVDAAYRLTEHLIERGHRRIAFLYGAGSATGQQRNEGYSLAMARAGLAAQASALRPVVADARDAALELLAGRQPPEALMASNGLLLLGVAEAVRELGLPCPERIAVAGFDDLPWVRLVDPGFTVIAQPTYDIGHAAIELLLQRIAQPSQAVRRVVLRGELIVRGSTAQRVTAPA